MSNHNREVDDLDYMLRDALRCTNDMAHDPVRVFAVLRGRIDAGYRVRRGAWAHALPIGSHAYLSPAYWYVVPLARVMH
ncbi:MAG: hypothetical protein IPP13_27295 [Kouleothrix sp.]|jgi:hypothetical protein|nr:hypothetical protein [Kouleothrix sp.]